MDIKEVIQYIAEQDLEINLTFQVSSDSGEDLKEEVRQLRKRIDELQMNGTAQLPEPEVSGESDAEEAPEDIKEAFEENTEVESDPVDEVPPEDDITEKSDLEDVEPEPSESGDEMQEAVSNEETISSLANEESGDDEPETEEEDDQFEKMFGGGDEEDVPTPSERRTPEDPPEEEPTEEERSEAGADFEELFGEV
jgi:hypothetical protein